ncbi:hypothetical protein MNBD_GAMMA09-297 [hydrothermal vent metagenome]|uniref:Lipoprotein n=1 Tax=hydrothermal vent metagenome TaxID=652676 RepID=A0A3B0Y117_9ZZZZ
MLMYSQKSVPAVISIFIFGIFLSSCAVLRGGKTSATDAVSTNVKDAYPVASWMNYFAARRTPQKSESFSLAPGYYTVDIQSYCLKAGTYAPSKGSGYLIAPLKGEKAKIIANILRRSEKKPGVKQQDIQRLIWGIETGANFSNYDIAFQLKVSPVLSAEEIVALSVDYDAISQLLPDSIKDALEFYTTFRSSVTDVQTSYKELEQMAVLAGVAPRGPGSIDVAPGPWAYAGNGFYMRALPQGYTKTTLEIMRPAQYTLERDGRGRIVVFQSGPYRIETSYDDSPGANVVSAPGKPDIQIWRFRQIRFSGPGRTDELIIKNKGWVLAPQQPFAMRRGLPRIQYGSTQVASLTNGLVLAQNDTTTLDLWNEANERMEKLEKFKDLLEVINNHRKESNTVGQVSRKKEHEALIVKHYEEGLDSAFDLKKRSEWLAKHMRALNDAMIHIICSLSGDCLSDTEQQPELDEFDPTGNVATPANTSQQRLGLSRRRN